MASDVQPWRIVHHGRTPNEVEERRLRATIVSTMDQVAAHRETLDRATTALARASAELARHERVLAWLHAESARRMVA